MKTLCFRFLPILANKIAFVYSASYFFVIFFFLLPCVSLLLFFYKMKKDLKKAVRSPSLYISFFPHLTYKLKFFLTESYSLSKKKREKRSDEKRSNNRPLFLSLSASYSRAQLLISAFFSQLIFFISETYHRLISYFLRLLLSAHRKRGKEGPNKDGVPSDLFALSLAYHRRHTRQLI